MTRYEFENSLQDPLEFWGSKTAEEVENLLGEETAKMVGFDQRNPHHCYDLFTHALYTVESLPEDASALLKTAAFFHDIGKPAVAKEKDGRLVFYGHSGESGKTAEPILEKLGYRLEEISEVLFYIEHHDDFIGWDLPEVVYAKENIYLVPITEDRLQKHIQKVEKRAKGGELVPVKDNWKQLLELCQADSLAQSDVAVQNGIEVGSKEQKLRRIHALMKLLENEK